MMDIQLLDTILKDCLVRERVDPDNVPDGITVIDVHFLKVGVDMARAESHRDELLALLREWPETAWGHPVPRLEEGPSYIHAGGVVDDQQRALVLFAVGEALGFWRVITPERLEITGEDADRMAGSGFVMIEGYQPSGKNT